MVGACGKKLVRSGARTRRSPILIGAAALVAAAVGGGAPTRLAAQVGAIGGDSAGSLQAPPVETGRRSPFVPGRAEDALPIGDWLIFPTAFTGLAYDSNINQASSGAKSALGLRLVPSMLAVNDSGLSKTTIYGMADARFYTDSPTGGNANATAARAGAIEFYQPAADWTINAQADYTRQQDLFSTFGVDHSVITLNPTGIGLAPTVNPSVYNQFTGVAAVQKNFARSFAVLGGSVVDQIYDTPAGAPSPNGVVYTGTGRGGIWITPSIYGFVQGSFDSRNYATSALSSTGYRAVGGLGSDRIGLVSGEVYAGYQTENYNSGGLSASSSSVFGLRGFYYPLPELTLSLAGDRTLGVSLLAPTATSPAGSSTVVSSVLGEANYTLAPEWTASARAGYIHTDYAGGGRSDNAWTLGPTLTYSVWKNFGVTVDFQHLQLDSNVRGQSFSREVLTLGLSYRY